MKTRKSSNKKVIPPKTPTELLINSKRLRLFRIFTLAVITIVVLVMLEFGLWLFGFGYQTEAVGKPDRAIQILYRAIVVFPEEETVVVHGSLGYCLNEQGKYNKAPMELDWH